MWLNFAQRTLSGTPYCSAKDTAVANESIKPETVEPSFEILIKISPGRPSSNRPTVTYPHCPPTENLCVIPQRSSGRWRRTARGVRLSLVTPSLLSMLVSLLDAASLLSKSVAWSCIASSWDLPLAAPLTTCSVISTPGCGIALLRALPAAMPTDVPLSMIFGRGYKPSDANRRQNQRYPRDGALPVLPNAIVVLLASCSGL